MGDYYPWFEMLGPVGAGKTTLCSLISKVQPNVLTIEDMVQRDRRRRVGRGGLRNVLSAVLGSQNVFGKGS